jgi:hypothetical protein
MKRALACAVGALVVALLGALLLIPHSACACLSPEDVCNMVLHVDPMKVGSTGTRTALATRFPVGTPFREVESELARFGPNDPHQPRACARDGHVYRCNVELARSAWRLQHYDLRLTIDLDEDDRVSNVDAQVTRVLAGFVL